MDAGLVGFRAAIIACALAAASLVSAQSELPDFGDGSSATLSPADERRLGEAFAREVRARLALVDDPGVEEYVDSVGPSSRGRERQPRATLSFLRGG